MVIKDENGNNLHSFDSLAVGTCANFLGVHPSTVGVPTKRIIKGIPFLLENKQAYIKKVEVND